MGNTGSIEHKEYLRIGKWIAVGCEIDLGKIRRDKWEITLEIPESKARNVVLPSLTFSMEFSLGSTTISCTVHLESIEYSNSIWKLRGSVLPSSLKFGIRSPEELF